MWRHLIAIVVMAPLLVGGAGLSLAAERTVIALATTGGRGVTENNRQLAENLLALIELTAQNDAGLAVVERRQIDLVIQEMILDQLRAANALGQLGLRWGKLATAELLVMLEVVEPGKASEKPQGLLRVVDAKTGSIRGVTVASLDEITLEETAEQFARYIAAVARAPQAPTVTVAVAPFESMGRFDRLRPLELGIRDLVTLRLLELSGAKLAPQKDAEKPAAVKPLSIQVLQRSNLEHLLRELDLIQSGFSDKQRLPTTLPSRQASYLVRGTIDERQVERTHNIVVHAEVLHAATGRQVQAFDFECAPAELQKNLSQRVDQIVERLKIDGVMPHVSQVPEGVEVASLKDQVMRDLRRFTRRCPLDFGTRDFRLAGEPQLNPRLRAVKSHTPLGTYLLRKSIDRLESILFIRPDDAEAAYALGFCYSMHIDGVYRPKRADELLRKAYSLRPQDELGALALALLGEITFDDESGHIDDAERRAAADRFWFAFERIRPEYRDYRWPRIVEQLGRLSGAPSDSTALAELLRNAAPYAEQAEKKHRHQLRWAVMRLAVQLEKQARGRPDLQAQATELLHRWERSEDPQQAQYARQGLANIAAAHGDSLGAAAQLEASAEKMSAPRTHLEQHERDWQRIQAAAHYRKAGQPQRALELLQSFKPRKSISLTLGQHGYEIGACYEALGDPQKALTAYRQAAEECPGIVDNSDITERIAAIGVPVREKSEVDVRYLPPPKGTQIAVNHLATDGTKIYTATRQALYSVDLASETWTLLKSDVGQITCLACGNGQVWLGTSEGLWRSNTSTGTWKHFGAGEGLPDVRLESICLHGREAYVGVGTMSSGGLVRISEGDEVHVFSDQLAPQSAPTHIVVTDKALLARTQQIIHELSFETKQWTQHPAKAFRSITASPRIFSGATAIWASNYGRELMRWGATDAENAIFRPAWYTNSQKAGYVVEFVAERGNEVWFGGAPWERLTSSGLYRFNLKTGAFHKFGPDDGFKVTTVHQVHDGAWVGNRLWLATSAGLCVLTPRE